MAKKFFYKKVHNTKKTIINLIIIGVCVIGIIVCFIITSNFQGENKNKGEVSLKSEVTIEVNEEYTNDIFFSKIENVDINDIKITYPDNFDKSVSGEYTVKITIDGKDYDIKLIVVDTIKPSLTLKSVTINKGDTYTAKDFVASCSDNSGNECIIDFYKNGLDEDGNNIDYTAFKEVGTYSIKITATDNAGNQNILETLLYIKEEDEEQETPVTPEIPTDCKYGNNEYDRNNYLLALDVTNGGCAISLEYYKNNEEIKKLADTETQRIIKDVQKLNLKGTPYVNREISAITNTTGDGIVGFELKITYSLENDSKEEIIAEYKLNLEGKRVFTSNRYNLES